ncbi:hypothetical protein EUGRSUZ_I00603 [Eucalyptus grandis]|uniref:Uncharacterized protein n=2 Tax=Eucalyptus grandis TaxID=71139 RepID=A0ACC3JCW7_EUCGR|nr:hypothetical protein EUGRSUZ_I00603 [Eucalyptus grandis]
MQELMCSSVGRFRHRHSWFRRRCQFLRRLGSWQHAGSLTRVGVGISLAGALPLCRRSWCRRWLRLRCRFRRRLRRRLRRRFRCRLWPWKSGAPRPVWERGQTGEPERRQAGVGECPGAMHSPPPLSIGGAFLCDLTAQAENKQDSQRCGHEEALHAGLLHFLSFWVGNEGIGVMSTAWRCGGFLYGAKLNRNDPQEDC